MLKSWYFLSKTHKSWFEFAIKVSKLQCFIFDNSKLFWSQTTYKSLNNVSDPFDHKLRRTPVVSASLSTLSLNLSLNISKVFGLSEGWGRPLSFFMHRDSESWPSWARRVMEDKADLETRESSWVYIENKVVCPEKWGEAQERLDFPEFNDCSKNSMSTDALACGPINFQSKTVWRRYSSVNNKKVYKR